ncbi:hypothetical protein COO60DRAFT_1560129 [Scenedesmus sp. NREL 46B-D3]|nr:hypothetical protein COO60DRAFT_1560129 [Scenedesmus sp. NREL 46B-D3]
MSSFSVWAVCRSLVDIQQAWLFVHCLIWPKGSFKNRAICVHSFVLCATTAWGLGHQQLWHLGSVLVQACAMQQAAQVAGRRLRLCKAQAQSMQTC